MPRVAIFVDIIKILTILIKTILKDSKKPKRFRNYISRCNLCLSFLISVEKKLISAELKECVT